MTEKTKKILLALKSPLERSIERSFFQRQGCEVVQLDNFDRLFDAVCESCPNLVIVDHETGEENIRQICSKIRSSLTLGKTKMLVILPGADNRLVAEYREMKIDELLFKPYKSEDLLNRTAELLDIPQRREMRASVKLSIHVSDGVQTHLCSGVNISSSGFFVTHNAPFTMDAEVDFELPLPGEDSPILGSGRIRRVDDVSFKPFFGIGVQYTMLSSLARMKIRNFVETEENP